jgi:hypothetical protein
MAIIVCVETFSGEIVLHEALDEAASLYSLQCALAEKLDCIPAQVNLFATTADGAQRMLRTTDELLAVCGDTALRVFVEGLHSNVQSVCDQLAKQKQKCMEDDFLSMVKQMKQTDQVVHMGGVGALVRTIQPKSANLFVFFRIGFLLRVELDVPFTLRVGHNSTRFGSVEVKPGLHARDVSDHGIFQHVDVRIEITWEKTQTPELMCVCTTARCFLHNCNIYKRIILRVRRGTHAQNSGFGGTQTCAWILWTCPMRKRCVHRRQCHVGSCCFWQCWRLRQPR